jgi:ABC-2 type transport system permease protein
MSTLTYAVHDSMTMLRRNLKHAIRYPTVSLGTAMTPILMLLLFVYAFGDSIGAGMGGGRDTYLEYLTPGIIIMAMASGAMSTSIAVCSDMTEGIINRFRTMNIARSSFMTGHVIGSVIQTMVSVVLVVAVALAVGFRTDASPLEWLAAAGLLAAITFAVTCRSSAPRSCRPTRCHPACAGSPRTSRSRR